MEFEGRISMVLPTRTGKRQDGTEWKSLPFVFEFFENPTDRFPDRVLLESTDHDIMRNIGKFVARGADKKAIVKDGQCELLAEIKCRCGWSHKVISYKKKDGSGEGLMNQMKPYRLEIHFNAAGTVAAQAQAVQQAQIPFPVQDAKETDDDGLPF